ncbi:MAG TPA: dihydroorotate dehydrogenase-like protein [Candidatus Krumholzibacteria bacterium]|nr:dihydroorotate dehydrogenase-like protein [Candidatus Krumholzibacteria bacterium]
MIDLTTHWLGLELKNPLVHSASPLSNSLESMKQLEDAGVSAIVMYSLFEEQINAESHEIDHYLSTGANSFSEASSYFPELSSYRVGPDEYLEKIRRARHELDIPIIASLNGVSRGGWVEYARLMQDAGAHALELNIYMIPTSPDMTGRDVEQMVVDTVTAVRAEVTIPLAVKVGPYFSAMANMAQRIKTAGADGLVLFNRFYQPDFDLESLAVTPHLVLSNSNELRLPLRWVAILYGRVDVDLGISSGVHSAEDVVKGVMAGANITMVTSALLRNGIGVARDLLVETAQWMEERAYESAAQMRGSMSQKHCAEPAAFERANYMRVLHSWRPDPTGKLTG